jgi:integrase
LRRTEVSQLRLTDYNPIDRTLLIRGKGNKERSLPVNRTLAATLDQWLRTRGPVDGPLFCRGSKADRIFPGEKFSPDGIYLVIRNLAEQASVLKISPHDFRRTFISALLDKTDINTVSKLVGHASVTTTARYDRRDEKQKRDAVESLLYGHDKIR